MSRRLDAGEVRENYWIPIVGLLRSMVLNCFVQCCIGRGIFGWPTVGLYMVFVFALQGSVSALKRSALHDL
jgi:hypothetical protein